MDVIARLPGCDGRALRLNWEMLPDCSKFPNQNVQMFTYIFHDTNGTTMAKCWRSRGTSWTNLIRSSIRWIATGDKSKKNFIRAWMGEDSDLGMYVRSSETRVISVRKCGRHENVWKAEYGCHVQEIDETRWFWRTRIISWSRLFGMYSTWMETEWNCYWTGNEDVWVTYFCWSNRTLLGGKNLTHKKVAWSYDMEGHAQKKKVEAILRIGKQESGAIVQSFKPLLGWSWIQAGRTRISWRLSEVCSQIVKKWLYLARIGRPDILWSVSKLARSVTKWAQACDRRLARLISYIHHTNDCRQCCHVGNTAQRCRLGLFQDSDLAGDLEEWKSTSGGVSCVLWEAEHLSQSVGCARNKLLSRTAPQSSRSFLWMLDYVWIGYLHSIFETWWLKCYVPLTTRFNPNIQANRKLGQFLIPKPRPNMSHEGKRLSIWVKWITYPQTHILLKKNLSCTSLKTTKPWSKW